MKGDRGPRGKDGKDGMVGLPGPRGQDGRCVCEPHSPVAGFASSERQTLSTPNEYQVLTFNKGVEKDPEVENAACDFLLNEDKNGIIGGLNNLYLVLISFTYQCSGKPQELGVVVHDGPRQTSYLIPISAERQLIVVPPTIIQHTSKDEIKVCLIHTGDKTNSVGCDLPKEVQGWADFETVTVKVDIVPAN